MHARVSKCCKLLMRSLCSCCSCSCSYSSSLYGIDSEWDNWEWNHKVLCGIGFVKGWEILWVVVYYSTYNCFCYFIVIDGYITGCIVPDYMFSSFNCSLSSTIGLWVAYWWESMLDSPCLKKVLEQCWYKLWAPMRAKFFRGSIVHKEGSAIGDEILTGGWSWFKVI